MSSSSGTSSEVVAISHRSRVDASPTFTLLSDQPHGDGDDPLDFERVARDLMGLILASRERTPFTVGVKGDWGAGKSSLMRRLERQLKDHEEVVSVWFNAWTSERGDTLEGLIKSVLAKVDTNILRRYARDENVITGIRVLTTLAAGPLRLGNVVDALWERASIDPKARNQLRKLIGDTMEEWVAKTPRGSDTRLLVVFVDDLDRCSPDAVFQVFEAIKLYLDARGFVFVIGFDETIVSEAILEQKKFSKSVTSQLYLDKIVQIEYLVPVPEETPLRALLDRLATASGITKKHLDNSARSLVVQGSDHNPRRLKRFINAFVLEHALSPEAKGVDPQTLIRELILRTYFQAFVRLYARGGDPLEEFSTYLAVRSVAIEGSGKVTPEFRRFFADNKTPLGDGQTIDGAALAELENKLPEPYTDLAQNENFISLVKYLRKSGTDRVRSRLETAPEVTAPEDPDAWLSVDSSEALRGMRILWVDDHPASNQTLVDLLRREGCTIEPVESSGAAEARLASGQPVDLIVSDIARKDDENAGLTALRKWRDKKLYKGPVIFYVSRITPEVRKEATSLGATVTNDPGELLQQVSASARPSKSASVA
jgi:CheY-like chemotaxis protein